MGFGPQDSRDRHIAAAIGVIAYSRHGEATMADLGHSPVLLAVATEGFGDVRAERRIASAVGSLPSSHGAEYPNHSPREIEVLSLHTLSALTTEVVVDRLFLLVPPTGPPTQPDLTHVTFSTCATVILDASPQDFDEQVVAWLYEERLWESAVRQRRACRHAVGDRFALDDAYWSLLDFVRARRWRPAHTGDSLSKSIIIEAAELLECFQWPGGKAPLKRYPDLTAVEEEVADILIYVLLLCRELNIDLARSVQHKLTWNDQRFLSLE